MEIFDAVIIRLRVFQASNSVHYRKGKSHQNRSRNSRGYVPRQTAIVFFVLNTNI